MKSLLSFRRLPFPFFVFFILTTGSTAYCQSVISGHIFDENRSPVGNIFVELQDDNYQISQTTRTDNAGVYFFRNLRSGIYYVQVKTIGTNFVEETQQVEIASRPLRNIGGTIAAGISYESKDFFLKTKRENAPPAARVIFAQEIPIDAKKAFDAAAVAFDKKNSAEAIQLLEQAVSTFPNYYNALEMLGHQYITLGKYQEATSLLGRAVDVNPRSFSGWYGRAYAQYSLGMSAAAIESANRAVTIKPNSAEAFLLLGVSYRQARQFELAEKHLKKGNDLAQGKSPDIHWNLALLYAHNLKRYDAAADELESYLKTAPVTNPAPIKRLIDQFRKRGKTVTESNI